MSAATMTETTYKGAINKAIVDALAADDDVFFFGEDVGAAGGAFKTSVGIQERFGEKRVLDTPISEQAIVGLAIGAAMRGLRPLAEIMFADFVGVAFDQIANQLAKYRYMTGGQVKLPVTIQMASGGGAGFGAQHSQAAENWLLNIPGLKLAVPGTPADAYGLMRAAVEDDDPVLFFGHKGLFNVKEDLPEEPARVELGRAAVVREGDAVTVVATQLMRHRALEAAEALAGKGVAVELIDPRTLVPFDFATIAASVDRTNHLVVVQEAPAGGSWGATLISRIASERFEMLDAPPALVVPPDTPVPYAGALEAAWLPDAEKIATAVEASLAY